MKEDKKFFMKYLLAVPLILVTLFYMFSPNGAVKNGKKDIRERDELLFFTIDSKDISQESESAESKNIVNISSLHTEFSNIATTDIKNTLDTYQILPFFLIINGENSLDDEKELYALRTFSENIFFYLIEQEM